jgi:serine/threonine protein kinase
MKKLINLKFSIKCDIWAFGIMLLEMLLVSSPMFNDLKLTYDENDIMENMVIVYRDSDYKAEIPPIYRDIAERGRSNFPRYFDILTVINPPDLRTN